MPLHVTILKNTNVMADQRKDCYPTRCPALKAALNDFFLILPDVEKIPRVVPM